MSLTESISQAIATMEGWFKPGTIAQRNNNPGNLRMWGNLPVVDGYAVFPTPDAGWAALNRQVDLNISRGLSLQEFFSGKAGVYGGYAPAADANDPRGYAQYVAGQIGVDPTIPLNRVGSGSDGTDSASISDEISPFGGSGVDEAGVVDWGLVAVLGLGLLAIWWMAD
jgi:hypothetical protein